MLRQVEDIFFFAKGDYDRKHGCTRDGVDVDEEGDGACNGGEGGGKENVHDNGK